MSGSAWSAPRSVFAHDVHSTDGELARLAAPGAAVAHCPSSNAFLGSGLFPLRRHLDVWGPGRARDRRRRRHRSFSMLKEALMAYQVQLLQPADGAPLGPAELLWLATAAGAAALWGSRMRSAI